MAGIVYCHASDAFAREEFSIRGRGYWSRELPLLLEKHGYLGYAERAVDALEHNMLWDADLVIVGRLPAAAWTVGVTDALLHGGCPVLLEGPLPEHVRRQIGITTAEPIGPHGRLVAATARVRELAKAHGYVPAGAVSESVIRESKREPRMDWRQLDVPISESQAAAWNARGWVAERWGVSPDVEVLAEWTPTGDDGEPCPGIIRHDHVAATSVSLFSYLVQRHTSEPFRPSEYRTGPRCTGLESLLLSVIDLMHLHGRRVRPRVQPWPRGVEWVLNIRHDFDRPLGPASVNDVLRRHRELGTAATWYWRARHLRAGWRHTLPGSAPITRRGTTIVTKGQGNAAVRAVASAPHQEIALHTELMWADSGHERSVLERVAHVRVSGSSSHGDPNCFRYQGAPNLLWAENQGLEYTELIQHAHLLPYRPAVMAADGSIHVTRTVALPHHESFDRSTTAGDVNADSLAESVPMWQRARGMLQVMNHPDQNIDELFTFLRAVPRGGRRDWTASEAVSWWRRSHARGEVTVAADEERRYSVSSASGVDGLVVELLLPDGTTRKRVLNLDAGATSTVGEAASPVVRT